MLNLDGVDANPSFIIVDIDQHLCDFPDTGDGLEGMAVAQDGEIGDGILFEKVRAGHEKKITDHQIGGPQMQQVGQRVENIAHIPTFPGNNAVYFR